VIVDLRKKRRCDTQFDYMVETYGLVEAIETWTEWDKEDKFHQGLLDWRLSGMTYKAIGAMCNLSSQKVSVIIKPLEREHVIRCDANKKKIEAILKREDPDYDYITNQRTVIQEMSALAMGGQEVLNILEQLSNLKENT
jgi:hypothetical protein